MSHPLILWSILYLLERNGVPVTSPGWDPEPQALNMVQIIRDPTFSSCMTRELSSIQASSLRSYHVDCACFLISFDLLQALDGCGLLLSKP